MSFKCDVEKGCPPHETVPVPEDGVGGNVLQKNRG
jgi:hypothetical protein